MTSPTPLPPHLAPPPVPAVPPALKIIAGILAAAAAVAVGFVPEVAKVPVLIVGAVFGYLSGASFEPPRWAAGTPVLQGAGIGIAGGAGALAWELSSKLPAGWLQTVVQVVGLVGFWLAGNASPQLGSQSKAETLKAAVQAGEVAAVKVTDTTSAVDALNATTRP